MPTVVAVGASSPARARTLASSHRAMRRGVPRTWTVPEPSETAVSASVTTSFASPRNPVATLTTSQAKGSTSSKACAFSRLGAAVDRCGDGTPPAGGSSKPEL